MDYRKQISRYSDKELEKHIREGLFNGPSLEYALEESKRRSLKKLSKPHWTVTPTFWIIFCSLALSFAVYYKSKDDPQEIKPVAIHSTSQEESIDQAKNTDVKTEINPTIEKKDTYYLPTNEMTEIEEEGLFITISIPAFNEYNIFEYVDIMVDSPGLEQAKFAKQRIGSLIKYNDFELRFMNFQNHYVHLKINNLKKNFGGLN